MAIVSQTTLRTLQDLSTEGRRAAGRQVVEGAALLGRQVRTALFQERVTTAPDYLGHFERRSSHGGGRTSSLSNGLRVDCSAHGTHLRHRVPAAPGAGQRQQDPRAAVEWLTDWANNGLLALNAFQGYFHMPRLGTENIKRLLFAPDRSQVAMHLGPVLPEQF